MYKWKHWTKKKKKAEKYPRNEAVRANGPRLNVSIKVGLLSEENK